MTTGPDMETLRKAFSRARVTVVGDVMSDEYWWGECSRISPEAPVPVVLIDRTTTVPGGAANVAMGIVALGARARLIGVVGEDGPSRQLSEVLADNGIDASGLVTEKDRPTTTKTRILAGSQQVVRADTESTAPLGTDTCRRLLTRCREALPEANAVVLSDYAKGVVSREVAQGVIRSAREAGIPVVVDPKGVEYDRFQGAALVTPNAHEVERATGLDVRHERELQRAGWALTERTQGPVLVTRGAQGMTLFDPARRESIDFPARPRAVFDVTGAGDTVVATMALSLGCDFGYEAGARLATAAAAAVISKVGTSTASLEDIEDVSEDFRG